MKIFRKIRQDLLGNNKYGKYFKYAIGEIVLVVIGILIALQINNWNQAKKDDKALNEYLVKIKSHTIKDLTTLDSIRTYRKATSEQCKLARKHILNKTEDENLFLFMVSGSAFYDYYFNPNKGGYEALKNSDYFGKINNTPLDSLLTRYYNIIGDIEQNESTYNNYIQEQENYISTQFDRSLILAYAFVSQDSLSTLATSQAEYFEDFKAYTSLTPYRNVIGLAAFQFDTMIFQYDQLTEVGTEIIGEIDNKLKE